MTLINHQNNYSYDIDTYVMRGTITMTKKEWQEAYNWLKSTYLQTIPSISINIFDSLSSLFSKPFDHNQRLFFIGVEATRLIATKYNLERYRAINYGIHIL
jgi:hypothetical protein